MDTMPIAKFDEYCNRVVRADKLVQTDRYRCCCADSVADGT